MSAGFSFIREVVGDGNVAIAAGGLAAALVSVFAFLSSKKISTNVSKDVLPDEGLSVKNLAEILVGFVVSLSDKVMGVENRKYTPFVGSLFIFLFACNLLGLIPGLNVPTDYFSFNLGVALIVFFAYNIWGVKEVGLINYLKHFCGPIWWVAPLLIVIELISHMVRPISLSLRLFGNMMGDHIVLSVFTDLSKFIIPIIFYVLGTFVCFMQAFVFTLLTMVYIRFAVTHEHEDDHGHSH